MIPQKYPTLCAKRTALEHPAFAHRCLLFKGNEEGGRMEVLPAGQAARREGVPSHPHIHRLLRAGDVFVQPICTIPTIPEMVDPRYEETRVVPFPRYTHTGSIRSYLSKRISAFRHAPYRELDQHLPEERRERVHGAPLQLGTCRGRRSGAPWVHHQYTRARAMGPGPWPAPGTKEIYRTRSSRAGRTEKHVRDGRCWTASAAGAGPSLRRGRETWRTDRR